MGQEIRPSDPDLFESTEEAIFAPAGRGDTSETQSDLKARKPKVVLTNIKEATGRPIAEASVADIAISEVAADIAVVAAKPPKRKPKVVSSQIEEQSKTQIETQIEAQPGASPPPKKQAAILEWLLDGAQDADNERWYIYRLLNSSEGFSADALMEKMPTNLKVGRATVQRLVTAIRRGDFKDYINEYVARNSIPAHKVFPSSAVQTSKGWKVTKKGG